ncbi:MAG TPA: PfkB family carbohydrate kinase [bacterium]|nr:PfkB family carbohydrate kinase [bacterium]
MSILVVGSVAFDHVKTPFGEAPEALGGSAVHFSAAASFFTAVRLVGVVGDDFPSSQLDFLRKRGVDTSGLEVAKGKTFRWKGEYGFDLNVAKTLETHLNVFADFAPKVPEAWREADVVFLGNIHPALQSQVLDQVKKKRLVALDTMNFWIEREPEALKKVIGRVDLVIINEGEARQLTGEASLVAAARKIKGLGEGQKTVVIKRGEYGSLLFYGNEVFSAPGLPLETVKDPTGAGDSFAGGFLGYVAARGEIAPATLRQAVIVGSSLASFNVEDFSCRRLQNLTPAEINARLGEFKRLAQFEDIKI